MLTEKEQQFVSYWEANREMQAKNHVKLFSGLPMSLLANLPILLFIIVVKLFFPEWYTKISKSLPGAMPTIILAVIIITLFFAFFRMHYKWENSEQLYKELKSKQKK